MIKKYLPVIALIGAASLLWWIKTNQRGSKEIKPATEQSDKGKTTTNNNQPSVGPPSDHPNREEGFNRRTANLIYSKHARCRMDCRHIDETEVKEILEAGKVNYAKVEDNARGKTYPVEGITHDKQHVRIVFAPKEDGSIVVVTCIDLDRDWSCDCN